MTKSLLLTLSAVALLLFSGCEQSQTVENQKSVETTKNIVKDTIFIEGMTCEGCESGLALTPKHVKGVVSFKASHVKKSAEVEYDKSVVDLDTIKKHVITQGYKIVESPKDVKTASKAAMKCGGDMKCGAGKCGGAK
ncbi:hypothetical protein N9A28_05965 [Sulfurimonas sp.]|nr:hypothetical protein [Sulfurimonas sp.]